MTKAMAKKKEQELAFTKERPDWLPAESARGQENVSVEDLALPRVDVIQDLSPQRKKNDPAYIEGADSGMLFNTVTGTLYGESVQFIPVYFRKEWLIWKAQDAGGGLVGVFATKEEAEDFFRSEGLDKQTYTDSKGNEYPMYEIVDHANHFGIVIGPEGPEEVVVSMSKSKMKISRQLNTLVKMAGGDRFSRVYELSAVEDQNKQGQTYYNFKIRQLGYVTEELYKLGERMYESISSSDKKVAYESVSPVSDEEVTEEDEF